MSKDAKIRRTITDLGYAPIISIGESGHPKYGPVVWLPHHRAGGREYDAQPAGTSGEIYADGRDVYSYEDNQGYDITLTTIGVTDDIDEDWYGLTIVDGKVEEYASGKQYPRFALLIVEDTTDGVGETTIFPMCQIKQRSAKQGATSEGNGLNPQFPQHQISARPRLDCMCAKMVLPSKALISKVPEPSESEPENPVVYVGTDENAYLGTENKIYAVEDE